MFSLHSIKRHLFSARCPLILLLIFAAISITFGAKHLFTPFDAIHISAYAFMALLAGAWFTLKTLRKDTSFLSSRSILILLGLSFVLNIVYNLYLWTDPWKLPLILATTLGMLAATWALMRSWALIVWAPFFLLELMQTCMYIQYGTTINSLVVAATLEASPEEISAYSGWGNILSFTGLLIVTAAVCYGLHRCMRTFPKMQLLRTGLASLGIMALWGLSIPMERQSQDYYWPGSEFYNLANAYIEAVETNEDTINQVKSLPDPTEQPSRCDTIRPDQGIILVVHIGESVRSDRLSLNGYHRITTPYLNTAPGLINFPHTISVAPDTCQAQISILTNGRRGLRDTDPCMQPTTGSILNIIAKHNFDIYSFFGNKVAQKLKYDRVVRLLTQVSKQSYNSPAYPMSGLPDIKRTIDENGSKNLVLFINNEGTHTPFCYFDEQHAPFQPAFTSFENPEANAEGINNAYDNTVYYLDDYIRQIVGYMGNRPFVYLYISDHGEFLGHDGIWGRGGLGNSTLRYHDTTGCIVPFFLITSPSFEKLHPHYAKALDGLRSNTEKTIGQEHIFHTLLGLFGIATPYYDPTLDLTRPNASPYTGDMPECLKKQQNTASTEPKERQQAAIGTPKPHA